jgi:oxygen-independent coproporphyrinogen-3 oxidase
MYAAAVLTLRRAGFEHYEVSNYAKQGHRSRHNQVSWQTAHKMGTRGVV